MDQELRELYQQVILDHNKNPRNFRVLQPCDREMDGFNPLCGDHIHIYMNVAGGVITDIAFQGNGCAISKSSASLMTSMVKGKTVAEAEGLFNRFHNLVTGKLPEGTDIEDLGKLAVFEGVKDFPARVKCASLAWHTLENCIKGETNTVTTE